MATSYIASTTARSEGASFNLTAGSSRIFYCSPQLAPYETCTLEMTPDSGTTWLPVGVICTHEKDKQQGVVTAQGAGATDFRVIKSPTATATVVYFD